MGGEKNIYIYMHIHMYVFMYECLLILSFLIKYILSLFVMGTVYQVKTSGKDSVFWMLAWELKKQQAGDYIKYIRL